uniref:PABPN1 like, cytoplasmic n=1 Tax=Dromaius novaehollandiae TaxID=8790 RepID=A0A8C4JG74_DRONO
MRGGQQLRQGLGSGAVAAGGLWPEGLGSGTAAWGARRGSGPLGGGFGASGRGQPRRGGVLPSAAAGREGCGVRGGEAEPVGAGAGGGTGLEEVAGGSQCPCFMCCSHKSWFAFQELEAIKARVREMEKEDERLKELQLEAESRFIMSSEAGMGSVEEKMEVDQRSIYVGNVDYGGTAEELESHFNSCGQINRVTILCDKFSGHPKGYAYIEFEEKSSVKAAVELDESMFRGRVIKVLPKRTNMPGISSTDRGGYRGRFYARGGLCQRGSYYGGQRSRVRGRTYRGRARLLPWYFPY